MQPESRTAADRGAKSDARVIKRSPRSRWYAETGETCPLVIFWTGREHPDAGHLDPPVEARSLCGGSPAGDPSALPTGLTPSKGQPMRNRIHAILVSLGLVAVLCACGLGGSKV